MLLPGTRSQQQRDLLYDASGTITTGGTAQLLLPERKSTSFLLIQNISNYPMFVKFGSAKAHATLTNDAVTSITVDDSGFGFTLPPTIQLLGGGGVGWNMADGLFTGCGQPQYPAPSDFATAQPVMASSAISGKKVNTITVTHGGSKYKQAPYVFIANAFNDPFGCATVSATSGVSLPAVSGSITFNGTACPTDAISIYSDTTSSPFTCLWLP